MSNVKYPIHTRPPKLVPTRLRSFIWSASQRRGTFTDFLDLANARRAGCEGCSVTRHVEAFVNLPGLARNRYTISRPRLIGDSPQSRSNWRSRVRRFEKLRRIRVHVLSRPRGGGRTWNPLLVLSHRFTSLPQRLATSPLSSSFG